VKTVEEIKDMIRELGRGAYRDGSSKRAGHLYHPIPFPEFSNLPIHKEAAEQEIKIIRSNTEDLDGGKILEIGCANGFYSFMLAPQARQIIAYEGDPQVCQINEAIRELKGIDNIQFINSYFDDEVAQVLDNDFDITIMLNVHMWIHKQIGPIRTLEMMQHIAASTTTLFFETAHAESGGMYQVKELRNKQDIENYLYSCGFNIVDHLISSKAHGRVREIFKCQ